MEIFIFLKMILTQNRKFKEKRYMNIIEFLKNGSGIHIKKENRGKFTDYCGGKVTSACIAKGKHSSNPAIRKRATFAANARKWKHEDGAKIKKHQAFVNGVSVLDSNPDAYKYVKKKVKMAQEGTKFGTWVNNNAGTISSIGNTLLSGVSNYISAKQQEKSIKKQNKAKLKDIDAQLKQQKAYYKPLAYQYALQQAQQETNGTDENISPIVVDQQAEKLANMLVNSDLRNQVIAENANAEAEANNASLGALIGTVGNIAQSGLGILANNIGNKTQNNVKTTSGVNTTSNTLDYTQYFGNKKPYYQTNFLA